VAAREKKTGAAAGLGPLPGGHHGLSREQVVESQRERLLAAIVTVVAAQGYRAATVSSICKEASVSSKTFYGFFDDKEGAFLAAFEAVIAHIEDGLAGAVDAHEDDWPAQTVAVLTELTGFFSAEPELARFCLLEPASATHEIIAGFRVTLLRGVPFLERGRTERPEPASLPPSTEDSIIGGLLSLATRAILVGSPPLAELLPDLVEFAFAPYLGAARAHELADELVQKR
jgi:AcrR family transcriptional regulator